MSEGQTTYEPGLYPDLQWSAYRKADALNGSLLTTGWKHSMLHLRHEELHGSGDNKAMATGRARHAALVDREHLANDYHVLSYPDLKKQAARDEKADAEAAGKEVIRKADLEKCVEAAQAALANPQVRNLLTKGQGEASAFAKYRGRLIKGRIDYLRPDMLVSYKTTNTLKPRLFWKTFHRMGYHLKEAFHRYIIEQVTGKRLPVWMILQEQEPPYDCTRFEVHEAILDRGESLILAEVDRYIWCEQHDRWPGLYEDGDEYPNEFPEYGMPEEQVEFNG